MIAIARENAKKAILPPGLYLQFMQELDLLRMYRTIIVPSSAFLDLVDIEDARKALSYFYDHLESGGFLAMSKRIMDASENEIKLVEIKGEIVLQG